MELRKTRNRFALMAVAIVTAIALVVSGVVVANADPVTVDMSSGTASQDSGQGGQGSIEIHLPKNASTSGGQYTYTIYKIFNATTNGSAISYKLLDGKRDVPSITGENKFILDDSGYVYYGKTSPTETSGSIPIRRNQQIEYLTAVTGDLASTDDIEAANEAIKKYISESPEINPTYSVQVTDLDKSSSENPVLTITGLTYGYYYITTDVGSAVALTSTNPKGVIQAKNDVPHVDKTITAVDDGATSNAATKGSVSADGKKALAELGSAVHYQSVIHVKKGAKNYVFKDKMDDSLSLITGSIKVQQNEGSVTASQDVVAGGNTYQLDTEPVTSGNDQYTFKITFADDFVRGLAEKLSNTVTDVQIVITYSAKVTSATLQEGTPGKNGATISYGGTGSDPAFTSKESVTEVYNALIKVIKRIGSVTGAYLPGAGFVIKNAEGQYYKYDADNKTVSWVANENEATMLTSNTSGLVVNTGAGLDNGFAGLADGAYTLIETVVPDGYNKLGDTQFTISGAKNGDTTNDAAFAQANLSQERTVTNQQGAALPTTGGMGTTILYVVGAILVIAAGVALVVRRRMRQQ